MNRIIFLVLLCWLIAGFTPFCFGQQADPEFELMLGPGITYSTQPYQDVDADIYPIPVIIGEYKNFYSDGKAFGYIFFDQDIFNTSLVVKPRFMGYDAQDSSSLEGMDDRDWSVDGGIRLSLENKYFLFDLTGSADLLNRHQGQEISAVLAKSFVHGLITPRVGLKWLSSSLLDYYYGVEQSEISATRADYDLSSELDLILGITAGYSIGGNWLLGLDIEYEYLGSQIQDSPIVDQDNIWTYIATCVYQF